MVTLRTAMGEITGIDGEGVHEFRGIRYAEPPVGERRFRPPVRTTGWDGVHDGTRWGARPPQNPTPEALGGVGPGDVGEDCLVVNVTVPAAAVADGGGRPVLCWIHGGAFTIGSGNDYPARQLARRDDLVVVTVGYRLGALGFLDLSSLGDEHAGSANHGIADQIAALGWIHDHIADFGGDPGNVTIAGESAGAISVLSILASPSADGRYHRAVACSTGGFQPPSGRGAEVLGMFDAALAGDAPLLDRLRRATTEQLLATQVAAGFGFGGTIDGTVVTRSMDEAVARASAAGVPLLVGSNADEGTLFHAVAGGDPGIFDLLTSGLPAAVTKGGDVDRYRQLLADAHPETVADDGGVARNLQIWNDFFRRPAVESAAVATEHGAGGWLYRFELPSTAFGGALGATHASDIAFTFDWFAGDDPLPGWTFHDRTDVTRAVAHAWSSAIARFARTGDPNGPGLPDWPRYAADDRQVLVIDDPLRVVVDPDEVDRKVWDAL